MRRQKPSTDVQAPGLFDDPAVTAALRKSRGRRQSRGSSAEDEFAFQVRAFKLPDVAREYRFAKEIGRQWRFDFAFGLPGTNSPYQVAVEIEGLVVRRIAGQTVVQGRHATITGFREDLRKYHQATILGWTVLRFEQAMVKSGEAIEVTQRVLVTRGWQPPELPF